MPVRAMKRHLQRGEIDKFLNVFETRSMEARGSIEFTELTQSVLPPRLRFWLETSEPSLTLLLRLRAIIYNGDLLLIDNDLREAINSRLDSAWKLANEGEKLGLEKLYLFKDEPEFLRRKNSLGTKEKALVGSSTIQRLNLKNLFIISVLGSINSYGAKRNVCFNRQEREFMKALRLYFPNTLVYPNVQINRFIDWESSVMNLSFVHRHYALTAAVDFLLCTQEEDPLAGLELDFTIYDSPEVVGWENLKNEIFSRAGIPLIRVRVEDNYETSADDFYKIFLSQEELFNSLRRKK